MKGYIIDENPNVTKKDYEKIKKLTLPKIKKEIKEGKIFMYSSDTRHSFNWMKIYENWKNDMKKRSKHLKECNRNITWLIKRENGITEDGGEDENFKN